MYLDPGRSKLALSIKRERPYVVCALLALVAIWCHRYPAGIDLPQHANIFRLWADLSQGPLEYRALYWVDWFTPYVLAYALAYPLTLAFGAVVAVKCLLTLAALGTPWMMRHWLKVVGGHQELGLFGFLLAFDFQYQCGFLSQTLAMPLMFGYLAACEGQPSRPGWLAMLRASLFGVALFFCHGITFGVCMVIVATGVALTRAWRRALHAAPLVALALLWLALHRQQTAQSPMSDWFATWDRLVTLLSGPFVAFPSLRWATVSLAAILLWLLVTRPHLVWQERRLLPLVLAVDCFLLLPETMAATTVIASRFCVYVHAFAPAAVDFRRTDCLRRQSARVALLLVWAGLLLLNVRLHAFNRELAGLHDVAMHMEPGMDVRNFVVQTGPHSEVFGPMQFGQVAAWITAEHGGLIDNDSTKYYQIPIKRNPVPFTSHPRYVVARGPVERVAPAVADQVKGARLILEARPWLLFEDRYPDGGDFTVVRATQSWRQLNIDRAVSGGPLSIAGVSYAHGLGTHAESFIRVRIAGAASRFAGACGVDDRERAIGKARFRIRDNAGEVLFESGEVVGGEPARHFSVPLAGRSELLLEVGVVNAIPHAHADWVDLRIQRSP